MANGMNLSGRNKNVRKPRVQTPIENRQNQLLQYWAVTYLLMRTIIEKQKHDFYQKEASQRNLLMLILTLLVHLKN